MPHIPSLHFNNKQFKIIKELMLELGYNNYTKLIRRALSIFNSLVKSSSGPDKKIYLIQGSPEEIKLSHNNKHYILDTSKVSVISLPLLFDYKKRKK